MITENEIREILKKRYGCRTGNLKLDFEELKKNFKVFHKYLAGHENVTMDGRSVLSAKYCGLRNNSGGKIKSISDCIEIL